eukprot:TRINITY_DN5881_c0_g1_i1.p2 TRINITY_DN5881_c0_g1~~TRINITY_DN5881_c0_g1_i1.p2  ORF type:complete len:111 (-),score=13.19 TRINITY_DN5881_c0_g1_i1:724-1056(-)
MAPLPPLSGHVRAVAEDAERPLLVGHIVGRASRLSRSVWHISIARTLAGQVLSTHTPRDAAVNSARRAWGSNEVHGARQKAASSTAGDDEAEDGATRSARRGGDYEKSLQ